jgi:hypothetical protein
MNSKAAERDAADVRRIPELRWRLNRVVADLNQNIVNARIVLDQAERLKREVRPTI